MNHSTMISPSSLTGASAPFFWWRMKKKYKGFRVYLHGKPRSVAMIDGGGATLDDAHKMAVWQFGADRVHRVISGEEERGD